MRVLDRYGSRAAVVMMIVLLVGPRALADCYLFPVAGSIEAPDDDEAKRETWCYEPIGDRGETFIFNADEPIVRPELSAVVDLDGVITHTSLVAGVRSVHRVRATEFNPIPVPIEPPKGVKPVASPHAAASNSQSFVADGALELLLTASPLIENLAAPASQTVQEKAEIAPWRGYWWPYKSGRMHKGASSPLAKFDRYFAARGEKTSAQAWESENHVYSGIAWEGHCNGWAGSAILREEPRRARRDRKSGVTFSVSDLKGLLAEHDTCVKYSFFGKRYRGKEGDDLSDIRPALFHQTIRYYVGRLKKPIVMDHMQGRGIDNHVVSGYSMSMKRLSETRVSVTTTLNVHRYDKGPTDRPGRAPLYRRTYKYTLVYDKDGVITGGAWQSKNPDFFWVPLSVTPCRRANPEVTEVRLNEIFGL